MSTLHDATDLSMLIMASEICYQRFQRDCRIRGWHIQSFTYPCGWKSHGVMSRNSVSHRMDFTCPTYRQHYAFYTMDFTCPTYRQHYAFYTMNFICPTYRQHYAFYTWDIFFWQWLEHTKDWHVKNQCCQQKLTFFVFSNFFMLVHAAVL
jgi:hypothetical protein